MSGDTGYRVPPRTLCWEIGRHPAITRTTRSLIARSAPFVRGLLCRTFRRRVCVHAALGSTLAVWKYV